MATEERHRPDVLKTYEGDGFAVSWEPALCIHTANCIRALPRTFNPNARPWVRLETASAEDVLTTVLTCPTGALRFERTDGAAQETSNGPTIVEVRPDGPLFVRGEAQVVDAEGNLIRAGNRMALCRCGHSHNKPFCDLSHRAAGFKG